MNDPFYNFTEIDDYDLTASVRSPHLEGTEYSYVEFEKDREDPKYIWIAVDHPIDGRVEAKFNKFTVLEALRAFDR